MIFSSVHGIKHPNLFGNWICCDLLKEQDELESGYTGGFVLFTLPQLNSPNQIHSGIARR